MRCLRLFPVPGKGLINGGEEAGLARAGAQPEGVRGALGSGGAGSGWAPGNSGESRLKAHVFGQAQKCMGLPLRPRSVLPGQ